MNAFRLTILLILIALTIWAGGQSSQAASPDVEQANPSGYIQDGSTPTTIAPSTPDASVVEATKTPQPTRAPQPTPPPSDPETTQLIAIFGVLLVVVILFGMVINRHRIF